MRSSTLRCSVYVATSLDGFISRDDGSIDWLDDASARVPKGEDCGFAAFMADVDVMVMGRRTYEQVIGFGEWPYQPAPQVTPHPAAPERSGSPSPDPDESADSTAVPRRDPSRTSSTGHESASATDSLGTTPLIVLSRSLDELPGGARPGVSLSSERPRDLVARLTAAGFGHVYIDGGATIRGFLADDLVDDLTITVIPVLLGGGRPLFGELPHDVHLEHEATRAFPFGFVQHRYRVPRGVTR